VNPTIQAVSDRVRRFNVRDYLSRPANAVFLALVALLVALHGFVFFATLIIAPIGFDEGFNLQAPLNLIQGNGYSTEDWLLGGPNLSFDAIVSTGPIVELPAALSMLLFGTSIQAARIVMLPFYVLLLVCLYILGRRIGGRWAGLGAIATVLALNTRVDWPVTVIYGPADALGEYAAAALIALALVLVPRHRYWAGLAIGFAALAKFIAFMAAPAFMVAFLIVPLLVGGTLPRVRTRIKQLVLFGIVVALPSVGWELVKLISLGFGPYLDTLVGYLRFVFRSGSGVDGSGRALVIDRASRLFAAWHLPSTFILVCTILLLAFALVGVWQWMARPEGLAPEPTRARRVIAALRRIPVEVWAAAGTLGVFALWWTFIATSIFIRHTMPVLLATVPLIIALAIRGVVALRAQPVPWLRVAAVVGVVLALPVAVWQIALTVESSTRAEEWTASEQQDVADFVRGLGVTEVQGIGWWASPDVRFLSHVPSTPIGTGTGPLILEPITRELDPQVFEMGLSFCADILYEKNGFIVCDVKPGIQPLDYGNVR
jgi:4-amino-4-deoxy-L-arabinose transferase-like glycosyltransferase